MTLPRRKLPSVRLAIDAPGLRLRRALARLWDCLTRSRFCLYGLAVGALTVAAMTLEGADALRAERDAAIERAEALAAWHAKDNVRVTLEGPPARIANHAMWIAHGVRQ